MSAGAGNRASRVAATALLVAAFVLADEGRHTFAAPEDVLGDAPVVVVPQLRQPVLGDAALRLVQVTAEVSIDALVARTTLEILLDNGSPVALEAEVLSPVAPGAVGLGWSHSAEAHGRSSRLAPVAVLPPDEVRPVVASLVRRFASSAPVELLGRGLLRAGRVTIPAHGRHRVRILYDERLVERGGRVDYRLTRTEALSYDVPWRLSMRFRHPRPVATVYSPSHELVIRRTSARELSVELREDAARTPGPYLVSLLAVEAEGDRAGPAATLFVYPEAGVAGGCFLLLAGLPPRAESAASPSPARREVLLALDRSGSMRGEKLDQALEAVRHVVAGLRDGEPFNVFVYGDAVERFSPRPREKTGTAELELSRWLAGIRAQGGTNLHDALAEVLASPHAPGTLPLVLFLTDGLPTTGETSEASIRALATQRNAADRRVFTFGVGVDVNTPLLEGIAADTRARATFVLPREDVRRKVEQVFRRLAGPVLAAPELHGVDGRTRVVELLPSRAPDLYEDDQLVLLGRYEGTPPLALELAGYYRGESRRFRFAFPPPEASPRPDFVPRLWASRRVATLLREIRATGADSGFPGGVDEVAKDPEFRRRVRELVRLSLRSGVLTEYTAFLADEHPARDEAAAVRAAERRLLDRAVRVRSGLGAVTQEVNRQSQYHQQILNPYNFFFDEEMKPVVLRTVQQVGDRALFRREGRWVDSAVLERGLDAGLRAARVLSLGSEPYLAFLDTLAAEGRQGIAALAGEILLTRGDETILLQAPVGP